MKPLIIFDFFGVMCNEISVQFFKKYFNKENYEKIKEEIVGKADVGDITLSEMFEKISQITSESQQIIENYWYDSIIINNELVNYITKLKKGNYVALLSNAPSDFLDEILTRYNLENLFHKTVISGHVGVAKPDKKIYEMVLKLFENKYNKVCFVDDNLKNLMPAEKLNITPIQFQSTQ